MKVRIKKHAVVAMVVGMAVILGSSWAPARADDLNPPPYRSEPLSVHAHWLADPTGQLQLSSFSWVDDSDPSTHLYPLPPSDPVFPDGGNSYQFWLPNFVDEMLVKFMRVQLTWVGTTQPPLSIFSDAMDGGQVIPGIQTFASNPLVFTQPPGGYQYFDFEFHPNPDFERVHVQLPPDSQLVQVVIDTVSTVPEPATVALLAIGGLAVLQRRRAANRA